MTSNSNFQQQHCANLRSWKKICNWHNKKFQHQFVSACTLPFRIWQQMSQFLLQHFNSQCIYVIILFLPLWQHLECLIILEIQCNTIHCLLYFIRKRPRWLLFMIRTCWTDAFSACYYTVALTQTTSIDEACNFFHTKSKLNFYSYLRQFHEGI